MQMISDLQLLAIHNQKTNINLYQEPKKSLHYDKSAIRNPHHSAIRNSLFSFFFLKKNSNLAPRLIQ